jgi:hypothetical protein
MKPRSAGATKNAAEVLYNEKLGMPMTFYEPLDAHITLSCVVLASGMWLLPVLFITEQVH